MYPLNAHLSTYIAFHVAAICKHCLDVIGRSEELKFTKIYSTFMDIYFFVTGRNFNEF